MLRELDICDIGLARCSHDEEHTRYGVYLADMGTSWIGHLEWPIEISNIERVYLLSL